MPELAVFVLIVIVVTVIGVRFGIVVLAPRIGRLLDHADSDKPDEESGDRPA